MSYGRDICKCGDYREDHEPDGSCLVCLGLKANGRCQPDMEPCREFRYHSTSRGGYGAGYTSDMLDRLGMHPKRPKVEYTPEDDDL